MRRHHHRALCITFRLRQFASVSLSARPFAIMDAATVSPAAADTTPDTPTCAVTVTGTDKISVEAAVSAATQLKADDCGLNDSLRSLLF